MVRVAQVGIALGALGLMLTLMGLFPGMTGIDPAFGIGMVQIFVVLAGFSLLIFGALIYAKFNFYARQDDTLAQQIGVRLALTGLVIAALVGLADVLGFGSHSQEETGVIFFGSWQAAGMVGGFLMSSIGVLLYSLTGRLDD
jgi:hypothetical protein